MKLTALNDRPELTGASNAGKAYFQLKTLLLELTQKELPDAIMMAINAEIDKVNATSSSERELLKVIKQRQASIIKILEQRLKIVPKNYYRNLWMAVGMAAFGLPIGVVFGLSIGNMGLIAIGLPIGMGIGTVAGTGMDKKAAREGRQLAVEIK